MSVNGEWESRELPRILLCSPTPIDRRLGASKVYIEAAEGFRRIEWDVELIDPQDVAGRPVDHLVFDQPPYLRDYLKRRAAEFDVVEYECHALPFPRSEFHRRPIFVARSVMLAHAQVEANIPCRPGFRGWFGRRVLRRRKAGLDAVIAASNITLKEADLINLCNDDEASLLARKGHPPEKLRVFPFGLFPERFAAFAPDPDALPDPPVVAFVGSFDFRKGMLEFPRLLGDVALEYPRVRFRLLGTAGLIPDSKGVAKAFPAALRGHLEIVPRYAPDELPGLIAGCSLGVFPSHVEGFPFGVLEMLAAGLPVVAYRVPGPPAMLPPRFLVGPGDAAAMAGRVIGLLADVAALRAARAWARARASEFNWEDVAAETAQAYSAAMAARMGNRR